ncbi:MAG TPA: response regulator [Longimicrobiaceae bacterium]|nr:response regulator [Longimicrobiaceae bacterium]
MPCTQSLLSGRSVSDAGEDGPASAAGAPDDVPDNRVILATLLEFHGYAVRRARNGSEAVRMAAMNHPALILMDMEMPVMDGWEAARRLRRDSRTAAVPVVALTAADLRAHFDRLAAGGFCGCLQKPVPLRRILEVVRLCLEECEKGRPWIDLGHVGIGAPHPQS